MACSKNISLFFPMLSGHSWAVDYSIYWSPSENLKNIYPLLPFAHLIRLATEHPHDLERSIIVKSCTGWWLNHPSEKWWSSSVGIILPNIYGKSWNSCSKPPTTNQCMFSHFPGGQQRNFPHGSWFQVFGPVYWSLGVTLMSMFPLKNT
jgi:hypothetical protein